MIPVIRERKVEPSKLINPKSYLEKKERGRRERCGWGGDRQGK